MINATVTENSLFNLISEFRNHTRLKANRKLKHSNHLTFSTVNQSFENFSDSRDRENYRDRDRENEKDESNTLFMNRSQSFECLCELVY